MYVNSVTAIFGPGLGKGVRKRLPPCLENKIRSMAPDEKCTGFIAGNNSS